MSEKRTRVSGTVALSITAVAMLLSVQSVAAAPGENRAATCEAKIATTLARYGLTAADLTLRLHTDAAGVSRLIKDLCAGGTPALVAIQKVREAAGIAAPTSSDVVPADQFSLS